MVLIVVDVAELEDTALFLQSVVEDLAGIRSELVAEVAGLGSVWEGGGFDAYRAQVVSLVAGYAGSAEELAAIGLIIQDAARAYVRVQEMLSGGSAHTQIRVDTDQYAPLGSGALMGAQGTLARGWDSFRGVLTGSCNGVGSDRTTSFWVGDMQELLTVLPGFLLGAHRAVEAWGTYVVGCANGWIDAARVAAGQAPLGGNFVYSGPSISSGVCVSLAGSGVPVPAYEQWAARVLTGVWLSTDPSELDQLGRGLVDLADQLTEASMGVSRALNSCELNSSAEKPLMCQSLSRLIEYLSPVGESLSELGRSARTYAAAVDAGVVQMKVALESVRTELGSIPAVTVTDSAIIIRAEDPLDTQAQEQVEYWMGVLQGRLVMAAAGVEDQARRLGAAARAVVERLRGQAGVLDELAARGPVGGVDMTVSPGWSQGYEAEGTGLNPEDHGPHCPTNRADRQQLQDLLTRWAREGRPEDTTRLLGMLMFMPISQVREVVALTGTSAIQLAPLLVKNATRWWGNLSSGRQEELIRYLPGVVGNMVGMPYGLRSRAYESLLTQVAASPSTGESTKQAIEKIFQSLEFVRSVGGQGMLVELNLADLNKPLAAVAVGDVDTAANVSWMVPGMDSTVTDTMTNWAYVSQNIYKSQVDALKFAGRFSEGVAVVAWVGYQAPNAGQVLDPRLARVGGRLLAESIDGFRVTRGTDPSVSVSVIAHSYGTGVAAYALKQIQAPINSAVLVGSPGLNPKDFPDISSLKVTNKIPSQSQCGPRNIWVSTASNDMLAWAGNQAAQQYGLFGFEANSKNPADPDFGARVFSSEGGIDPNTGKQYTGGGGHDVSNPTGSGYFDPESESATDIGLITTGQSNKLTPLIPRQPSLPPEFTTPPQPLLPPEFQNPIPAPGLPPELTTPPKPLLPPPGLSHEHPRPSATPVPLVGAGVHGGCVGG